MYRVITAQAIALNLLFCKLLFMLKPPVLLNCSLRPIHYTTGYICYSNNNPLDIVTLHHNSYDLPATTRKIPSQQNSFIEI